MPPKKLSTKREIIDLTADDDDVIDLTQDEEKDNSDSGQIPNSNENKPNNKRITFEEIQDPKPPEALMEMFRLREEQGNHVIQKKKINYILVHIL